MKPWNELTRLEQLAITHWDAYKDAMGVRPRWIDTREWTEQDFEREIDLLIEIMQRDNQEH